MTPEQRTRLDALVDPWRTSSAPGGCIAVAQHGRTVYREAFGMADLRQGVALGASSRIAIGSVTKQFTCTLALLLADEGVLGLGDRIGRWLPELSEALGRPTLAQLMTHTAGIPCPLDLAVFNGYATLPAGYPLAFLMRQQSLAYPAGRGAHYSNGGYVLLSEAIARAAGEPLDALLARRLFEPLGMRSTDLPRRGGPVAPGTATLHVPAAAGGGWHVATPLSSELLGEGGIVSTADDLLRWAAWLRDPRSPVTLDRLATLPTLANGETSDYGFGVVRERLRGIETIDHVGGLPGGNALLAQLPAQGTDIALLFNRNVDVLQLAGEIVAILHADAVWPTMPAPRSEDFRHVAGRWLVATTGFVLELVDVAGELRLSVFGGAPMPLPARAAGGAGELPFAADVGLGEMRFRIDAPGLDGRPSLAVREGGEWHGALRIDGDVADAGADAEAFVRSTPGRFRRADGAASLRFTMRSGSLVVATRGELGESLCPARLLGADLVHFRDPQFQSGPVALVERDRAGRAMRLRIASARTGPVVYERVPE